MFQQREMFPLYSSLGQTKKNGRPKLRKAAQISHSLKKILFTEIINRNNSMRCPGDLLTSMIPPLYLVPVKRHILLQPPSKVPLI